MMVTQSMLHADRVGLLGRLNYLLNVGRVEKEVDLVTNVLTESLLIQPLLLGLLLGFKLLGVHVHLIVII
jgi:hypothetical protein